MTCDNHQRENLVRALNDAVATLQRDCEELERIARAIEELPPSREAVWERVASEIASSTFAPKPRNLLPFVRRGSYLDHVEEFPETDGY